MSEENDINLNVRRLLTVQDAVLFCRGVLAEETIVSIVNATNTLFAICLRSEELWYALGIHLLMRVTKLEGYDLFDYLDIQELSIHRWNKIHQLVTGMDGILKRKEFVYTKPLMEMIYWDVLQSLNKNN